MVPEGGSAVYGVRLSSAPVGVLHLDVSRETGGDPDLSVQPGGGVFDMARLTFNADNWNVYQSVTVLAAQDVDAAGRRCDDCPCRKRIGLCWNSGSNRRCRNGR